MQQLKQVDKIAYVRFAIVYKDFKEIAELEDELLSLRNFP
jgi:transcriptional regulator NrdR family protein